jgi:hypothetical protein
LYRDSASCPSNPGSTVSVDWTLPAQDVIARTNPKWLTGVAADHVREG